MKICIILLLWLNIKLAFSSEIRDLVLQTQNSRRMQTLLDTNLAEMDGQQLKEAYYELVPQVQQNSCQILKKIGGAWMKNCGFWDGEKLICMDKLAKVNIFSYLFGGPTTPPSSTKGSRGREKNLPASSCDKSCTQQPQFPDC